MMYVMCISATCPTNRNLFDYRLSAWGKDEVPWTLLNTQCSPRSPCFLSLRRRQSSQIFVLIHTYIHNPGTQPQRRAVEAIDVMNHAVTLSGTSTNSTGAVKSNSTRKRGNDYRGDHIRKHDNGFKTRREDTLWEI